MLAISHKVLLKYVITEVGGKCEFVAGANLTNLNVEGRHPHSCLIKLLSALPHGGSEPKLFNAAHCLNGRDPRITAIVDGKDGPFLPLVAALRLCAAARQRRYSPQVRHWTTCEVTQCGHSHYISLSDYWQSNATTKLSFLRSGGFPFFRSFNELVQDGIHHAVNLFTVFKMRWITTPNLCEYVRHAQECQTDSER